MNKKYPTILSILIITIMSACGPAPEPTLSAGDIASTAVANAWLAMTATQAALPTATATFPPTETFTPQPTFTFIPLATLPPVNAVVATATSQCNQVPPLIPKGKLVNVEFKNDSDGLVNFSFGMNSPNSNGECVTYGYSFGKFDTTPAQVLAGCYWAYGWVDGGNNQTSTTQGTALMCMTDSATPYHIIIGKETVILK
jgi:hypothetical protein